MMSEFKKKTFSRNNNEHPDLLQFANEQRKIGLFNDVFIEVDNELIPANKMVLSCYSDYFKNMFGTPINEVNEKRVKLTEVDKISTKLLLDYIYTGVINIDEKNIKNLLSAADHLQVDHVKQFCFEFLESIITTENWFEILKTADLYGNDSMKSKVYQFISLKFNEIVKIDTFLNLSKTELESCISNLDRNQTEETSIYDAMIAWVKFDEEKRVEGFPQLYHFIQMDNVPMDYLATVVSGERLVTGNLVCSNLSLKAIAQKASGKFFDEKLSKIFSSVLTTEGTFKLFDFDQSFKETRTNFPNLPLKCLYGHIFKVNSFVFCAESKTVWRLHLNVQNKEWQLISDAQSGVFNHLSLYNSTLVNFDNVDKITYTDLPLCESENIRPCKWQPLSSLNQTRRSFASACCAGCLYVFGGKLPRSLASLSSVERLPGLKSNWKTVKSMQRPRSDFTAVSYKHFVFVLGGYDSINDLYLESIERFDSQESTWIFVKAMLNQRRNHKACILDDKIFVAGGYNENGYVMDVECYDILSDEWSVIQKKDPKSYQIISICS